MKADNKEQKAAFLVLSRTCTLVLRARFFCVPDSGAKVNLRARKVGRLERNLPTLDH